MSSDVDLESLPANHLSISVISDMIKFPLEISVLS